VGYASDLTDAESDEECAYVPRVPECVAPRSSKRTRDALSENGVVPERRVRSRIDEQLELLRAVIPVSGTVSIFGCLSSFERGGDSVRRPWLCNIELLCRYGVEKAEGLNMEA